MRMHGDDSLCRRASRAVHIAAIDVADHRIIAAWCVLASHRIIAACCVLASHRIIAACCVLGTHRIVPTCCGA